MKKRAKDSTVNGIGLSTLVIILLSISIVLILSMVKIYYSNQIYYESRRVGYIRQEVSALREEQILLEAQLQQAKFKNRVTDTIYTYTYDEGDL
jgi:lipopolysaccharide/colanic/teichoic acid biosynthesis glycosyltransferase